MLQALKTALPEMLPEDEEHPPRPDVPVLRHLTFTEVHAVELGIYLGFFICWGLLLGEKVATFGVVAFIIRKLTTRKHRKDENTPGEYELGFNDARAESPYFGFGVAVAVAVWLAVQYLL